MHHSDMQQEIAFVNYHPHEPYESRRHRTLVSTHIGKHHRNRSKPLQRGPRCEVAHSNPKSNKNVAYVTLLPKPSGSKDTALHPDPTTPASGLAKHLRGKAGPISKFSNGQQSIVSVPRSPASGRGRNVDPFSTTSLGVYHHSVEMLFTFTTRWERSTWGWAWGRSGRDNNAPPSQLDTGLSQSLEEAISDPRHMLTLLYLANTQNRVEAPSVYDEKFQSVMAYKTTRLLSARTQDTAVKDSRQVRQLLFDITFICLAAVFQGDFEAALCHLRGAKALASYAGGLLSLPRYISEMLLQSDYIVAWRDLTPTVFDIYDLTQREPPNSVTVHPVLLSDLVTFTGSFQCPQGSEWLGEMGTDVVKCIIVFSTELTESVSLRNARWMVRRCHALVLRLLSKKVQMESIWSTESSALLVQVESTRISMLLWLAILLSFTLYDSIRFTTINGFSDRAIESFSTSGMHIIANALKNWNAGIEQLHKSQETKLSAAFSNLCAVIEDLETDGFICLGPLMQQFFSLARTHHHWSKYVPPGM